MTPTFRTTLLALPFVAAASTATAQGFEVETGLEALSSPNTLIEGLHRLYVGRRISPTFSFGQSVYSAALGDAGGAFFWGFEGVVHVPLSDRVALSFSGFLGGGGGAAQVIGDGTMLRAGVSLDYRLNPAWDLQLGASWIAIDGAPINGPALGMGLRYRFGEGTAAFGGNGMPQFDGLGIVAAHMVPAAGVLNRAGGAQAQVSLVGVRALFHLAPQTELMFTGAGGARGAQGYMHLMGGVRRNLTLSRGSLFIEGSAGFGGGGEVDTGSGLLVGAALGGTLRLSRSFDLEVSLGAMAAPDGAFRGAALSLGVIRAFTQGRANPDGERWAFSAGMSVQHAGPGYYIAPAGRPSYTVMQETSIDYFVGERLYVTGNAQTTMHGSVAGYALGMVGLGYELPLNDRWSLSVEGHLGAAGGGGVNTAGGIIAGLRAEVDYRMGEAWRLSMGLGRLQTLRAGGMQPTTLTLGVKIPFRTH